MKAILFVAAFFAAQSASGLMDVEKLNQILKEKHAGWVAKPNSFTNRSLAEIKGMMGVKRSAGRGIRFHMNSGTPKTGLPAALDWRLNGGNNWVTPILDQGYCGSCVAFAVIGTLETQYRIASGFPNFNVRLSPQYLFACGGGGCDTGWEPGPAASFLQQTGVPGESCMPYTSGETDLDVSCSAACPNASTTSVKIASFTTPTRMSFDINALKQALQKGPLVTTLDVYADFMEYSSGVYQHVTGDMLGGHAVSIIGYDDSKQALIIRNSWGEDWGENGFAYVAYTDISGVGDETWLFAMPSISGGVSIQSPVDYSYFTGTATVTATSTYASTDSISVSFFNTAGTAVWNGSCQSASSCNLMADVSGLADGQYQVQATAMGKNGQLLTQSLRQTFYVSNQKPKLTLSFEGTQGTDFSQTLSGVILMSISVASSNGVPLNSVIFHHKGPDGKEVTRGATAVADGMLMDWGTENWPNGAYEIWMEGHLTTNGFDDVVVTPHITVQSQN